MNGFRAVLFDFDGTLIDSYAAIAASVNHIRAAHGFGPLDTAEVKPHVGRGPAYLLEHTVPGCDLQVDLARYRAHHPTVMIQHTFLLPGAKEALTAVKHSGRLAGICSNKPRMFTRELVEHFEIAELLDIVLGPEDVPRPKPAPDMLLAALHRLQLPAAAALYIGDMTVDIQTARAAGMPVWIVPTGSDTLNAIELEKPDRLLRDLHELISLV